MLPELKFHKRDETCHLSRDLQLWRREYHGGMCTVNVIGRGKSISLGHEEFNDR